MEAYDQGVPKELSSDLDLIIYVHSIDNYEPAFLVQSISVNFTGLYKIFHSLFFFCSEERKNFTASGGREKEEGEKIESHFSLIIHIIKHKVISKALQNIWSVNVPGTHVVSELKFTLIYCGHKFSILLLIYLLYVSLTFCCVEEFLRLINVQNVLLKIIFLEKILTSSSFHPHSKMFSLSLNSLYYFQNTPSQATKRGSFQTLSIEMRSMTWKMIPRLFAISLCMATTMVFFIWTVCRIF